MKKETITNVTGESLPEHKMPELKLPQVVFRYETVEEQLNAEASQINIVKHLIWHRERGIELWHVGAEYPQKNFTSQETIWALNFVKRNFMEGIRLLSKWYFYPTYIIAATLPWKYKTKILEQFIHSYAETSHRIITPFILKEEYMTKCCREIEWAVYSFLEKIGVHPRDCVRFSEIFSSMIEYDNAYRLRVEDVFSETTKEQLLKDPAEEILRLFKIMAVREQNPINVLPKFKLIAMGVRIALWHPRIKRIFRTIVEEIDVSVMGLDDADKYWASFRSDYNFMGMTYEERTEFIKDRPKPEILEYKK